jgi:hypothetical protein
MNTAKRIFDVHILESNRSGKTAEGEALGRVLDISGIRTHHYAVHTVDELASAFGKIAKHPRCLDHHRHFLPFLHFALHASEAGVFIKGKLIRWDLLRELLSPLRDRLQGNLMIAMSACAGFYAYQLACSRERFTYNFLVGTRQSPLDWRDSILAFHIFYHSLFVRKAKPPEAVAAMNVPLLSRRYSFGYTFGSEVQRLYRLRRSVDEQVVAIRGRGNSPSPRPPRQWEIPDIETLRKSEFGSISK